MIKLISPNRFKVKGPLKFIINKINHRREKNGLKDNSPLLFNKFRE